MIDMPPLFLDIKSSKFTLYFLITAHALAILSILLIDNSGVVSALLKILLIIFVIVSFKRCLNCHQNNIQLHLKTDNLVDLNVGGREYHDLQLSGESYISDILLQLVLLDDNADVCQTIIVLPDSIDAAMHSRLRSRLKLSAKHTDAISV